ncbi:MAG: phosphate acyltransferase PlsX [Candidatus Eiseniibacteriota bacterium]
MTGHLTIALDAMGGDNAPQSVLNGANLARKRFPHVRFVLVGDEARLAPMLDRLPRLKKVTSIRHTDQVVTDDAKPSVALRSGRGSSMRLAVDTVHEGLAAGIVSAGNTGALMAISKFVLKTLKGIDRPAMAGFFPTMRGESVMLDLGANVECTADNLVQFAALGEVFARTVLGLTRPTVGLLNVGSEELKGNDAVRAAAARLKETTLPIDFHGFIEGNDIAAGTVDVIVADGFTGNIALKTAEGTAKLYTEFLRQAFKSSTVSALGYLLARPALRKLRKRVDPRRYNGAVFLGLNGIVVKSHGGSDSLSFATAIGVAVDMAVNGFLDTIRGELERLQTNGTMDQPAAAVKA